ncbi:MAG: DNA repair protein RadA [Proteobacteria bacterium]|nr:DNA repair protein RadA [Pseudomonadota bacterium]
MKSSKKTVFVCGQCGSQQPKWLGKCPDCNAWNSFSEDIVTDKQTVHRAETQSSRPPEKPTPITDVRQETIPRIFCGLPELDRVLGGGLVQGSLVLISGDPGVGKSTLLLQALFGLASQGYRVLYASGEESREQIKLRADRLKTVHPNILLFNETDLGTIAGQALSLKPHVLVVDSIQTVAHSDYPSSPGSVTQVRECTARLMDVAKLHGITTWIVGHVTKEGSIAGPRVLEHLVDTVMHLEGDAATGFRILRSLKNRFGSTGEVGVFSMQANGLSDVANPSALFLESLKAGVEGSAVAVSMEGTRPLLVEIQSLVGKSTLATPRRTVTGLDPNRFAILLAVLERRAGVSIGLLDIYANVAGGLRLSEPASDLAVAASVLSSVIETPWQGRVAFFGEVGLSGEIRATTNPVGRVQEAMKLGFDRVYMPRRSYQMEKQALLELQKTESTRSDMQIYPVEHIRELRHG